MMMQGFNRMPSFGGPSAMSLQTSVLDRDGFGGGGGGGGIGGGIPPSQPAPPPQFLQNLMALYGQMGRANNQSPIGLGHFGLPYDPSQPPPFMPPQMQQSPFGGPPPFMPSFGGPQQRPPVFGGGMPPFMPPQFGGGMPQMGGPSQPSPVPMPQTGGQLPPQQMPQVGTGGPLPPSPMMPRLGGALPPMGGPLRMPQPGNGYDGSGINPGGGFLGRRARNLGLGRR